MASSSEAQLADIRSGDQAVQGRAFTDLMGATEAPVDWAYEWSSIDDEAE